MPLTHVLLYFPELMTRLCRKKFKRFGKDAEFRPGAFAIGCSKISLGNRVIIRPHTFLFADAREKGKGITIEDNVMIASGVHMYCVNHRFDDPNIPLIDQGYHESMQIILKSGCWIGAACILLPGVTIGENTVVGAGSVVTRSLPDNVVAVGSPARAIKKITAQNL